MAADRRIEWQIALETAGVSRGVKGVDAELSAMRRAFDALQQVKAFDTQLAALSEFASKLEAAKAKAAALATAAETGGKRAQVAYDKAALEVSRLEQSFKKQTAAVAASAAGLERAGVSTRELVAETNRLAEEYKQAAAAAGQAAKMQEAWAATGVRSTKELEAEIAKLQQLTKSGLLDARGISAAEERIASLNKELGSTPPAAQAGVISLADLTKGAAGLAAAYLSVETARQAIAVTAEFSDELQAVAAYSGATAAEIAKLRQNALDLSGAAGGPRAIAAGMADLATAGASASEILGTTGIVRDMAAASKGSLDFASAGDLLTNVLKQYGLQITDAQLVADKLVKGWSSAGQSADQLGSGLLEVGAIYKDLYRNLGNTAALEKSAAAISVLADVGFKGEKGGTALKNALAQIVAPAGQGAKVLEKYKDVIKVFDDVGNVRDFADIINDVGRAGLSSQEKMVLFGREAGPAMAAMVSLGGNAIREMEAKLKDADDTASKVQTTMQEGLGGAIRQAKSDVEKAAIVFAEEFSPALRAVLSLAGYLDNAVQAWSANFKLAGGAVTDVAGAFMHMLRPVEAITDAIGLTDSKTNTWKDNAEAAAAAANGMFMEAAAASKAASGAIDEVAEAQKRLDGINAQVSTRFKEISQATGVTVTTMQELDAAVAAGKIKWDEATASWIGSEKQKQDAVYKTAADAARAAEEAAEAEDKARKVAEKAWEDYGEKVKRITEEIAERTAKLDAELNKMARSGMSAAEAQAAIKKEAEDAYASAQKLAAAGNFEAALQAADAAKQAWADFAGDVKGANSELESNNQKLAEANEKLRELRAASGEDGIITENENEKISEAAEKVADLRAEVSESQKALQEQKAALEEAMAGVKASGELGIDILSKQKDEYQQMAENLNKAFDFSSAGEAIDTFIKEKVAGISGATASAAESVTASMDASATSVAAASERITSSINAIPSSKEITITERYVQERAGGGLVQGFASGGSPAFRRPSSPYITIGSGRRDDVPAMLMRNEYVLKASSVAAPALRGDGIALAHAHNTENWAGMQAILAKHLGPPQIMAAPPAFARAQMPELGVLKLHVGSVQTEVYATAGNAALLKQAVAAMQRDAALESAAKKRAGGRHG